MSNYIKVTKKDGTWHVTMPYCREHYEKTGAKIEYPTQAEIEKYFPGTQSATPDETAQELKKVKAELETVRKELESEKTAHTAATESYLKENAELKAELEKGKAALNEAKKQISKLSKKE